MNFFEQADLKYYSTVIGRKFNKGDHEFEEIGQILTSEGVFAKTGYWAGLIKEEGYSIEFSNHWQISGEIRSYTWARIYFPGFEDSDIYFTIGVGSKYVQEGNYTCYLEYKLDCQRKKGLSQYQIGIFDDFVSKNSNNSVRNIIKSSELEDLTWDKLIGNTLDYIEEYEEHYYTLIKIIWPNGIGVIPKIARVCWNIHDWKFPSGPEGKSTSTADAFEKEKGYGYEEWLFDTKKLIDGYHYAFLQAFNKGKHEGEAYDVLLYAINNDIKNNRKKYCWIGQLNRVEVLTKKERQRILAIYKSNGWYDEMLAQLKQVKIQSFNFKPISEGEIFNIRYKVDADHYKFFKTPIKIEDPNKELGKNRHYVLLDRPADSSIDYLEIGKYKFSEGHNPTKTGVIKSKYTKRGYQKLLLHKEIQEKVFEQLTAKYQNTKFKVGTENDAGYGKSIDLVVHNPDNGDIFYEIKTGSSGLGCIRQAFGQIVEYCYFPNRKNANKLIIVALHSLNILEQEYLKHLRNQFGIELYYQRFSIAQDLLLDPLF